MINQSSEQTRVRAQAIARLGGLTAARLQGALPAVVETSVSEALVLGLLKQGVRKYFAIFGHGSTDLAEVLRIYDEEGVTKTFCFRNEVEMAHAATALKWVYAETPAVVTSIGPGALQAFAASLAAASNGVGLYHIYGDETSHGEGYNMQQVPKAEPGLYGQLTSIMSASYTLHTPEALRAALRNGARTVFHPHKAAPFFLLLPINVQPARVKVALDALPERPQPIAVADASVERFERAAEAIASAAKVVVKIGGGARAQASGVRALVEAAGAVGVLSPGSLGVLEDDDVLNMHVGGSKGSLSGNFAMSEAEVLVVVGSRAVCQSDCSGIGYPNAKVVVNLNADWEDVHHYNHTIALLGDLSASLSTLTGCLRAKSRESSSGKRSWRELCERKKREWKALLSERTAPIPIVDEAWKAPVLPQPAAIAIVADFAKRVDALKFFDAGDVQANGFQIVSDELPGSTFTESGASYMGFAASALLSQAAADHGRYGIAFCGDGSFMMNPQILIDAVALGARGMIVVFDNRRMAAISGLQRAQYGHDFRTSDGVEVDYVAMASSVRGVFALRAGPSRESLEDALERAHQHAGLSLVHVPVYFGENERAGMGAYGSWNVGPWCAEVQEKYHSQTI